MAVPKKCNWPSCLSPDQSRRLCESIHLGDLGIPTSEPDPVCNDYCDMDSDDRVDY